MDILFHDQGYKYFYPLEPKNTDSVTIRLQADRKLKSVVLLLKEKDSKQIEEIELKYEKQDVIERFSLYVCEIPPKTDPYRYCFKSETEDGTVKYLNVFGESDELNIKSGFYVIPDFTTPDWSKGIFWYSVLPHAFRNGNLLNDKTGEIEAVPFGGGVCHPYCSRYCGDIEGVKEKLDYIKDIGADAVYMNPLWTCKDAAGYGPDNFDMLDPAYCNDKELSEFVKTAHEKDLRVMLDAVVVFSTTTSNLCNQNDEWIQKGALVDQNSKFCDYFHFKRWPDEYQNYFASLLFDFNKDIVKDYLYRNEDSHLQRYLKPPYNIDAWRFDSSDLLWGEGLNAVQIAADIKTYLKKINPDMLFLGENYGNMDEGVWETCWNMHHLFNLREWILKKYDMKFFLWKMRMSLNERSRPLALSMYTHFDTHDVPRLYPQVDEKERLLSGIICQMTYLGSPTLYYGDETGDKNLNIGYYHNFNWDTDSWDTDFYKYYKLLGTLRHENNVFKKGIVRVGLIDNERELLSYGRFDQNGATVTVVNPNKVIKGLEIPVDIYDISDGATLTDIISGMKYTVENGVITADVLGGGAVYVLDLREDFPSLLQITYPDTLKVNGIKTPERDWNYRIELLKKSGDFKLVVGDNAENGIYLSYTNKALSFGRIVSDEKIPFFTENANTDDITLQIERIGTRYRAFYCVDDGIWRLLGENLFASFNSPSLYINGIVEKQSFGNIAFGGNDLFVPISYKGFDGEWDKLNSSRDLLKLQTLDSADNYAYVNGGIERVADGFGTFVYHKSLKNFKINVSLLPLDDGECGILFGADSNAQGGYKFFLNKNGEYSLCNNGGSIIDGIVPIDEFGADFIIEAFANSLVLYHNNKVIFFDRLGDVSGYIGYFGGKYKVLNFMVCDLSEGVTTQNVFWNIKGNKAAFKGTGLLSVKGRAYSDFKASVKIKIAENTEKLGCAGILTAANESLLPRYDGLFFAISSDGNLVVKSNSKIYYNELIKNKTDEYLLTVQCTNGEYNCAINGEYLFSFGFKEKMGGAVSLCTETADALFEDFNIMV